MLSSRLLPHIRGNVGFVFTKEDLTEIRDMLLANKVRGGPSQCQGWMLLMITQRCRGCLVGGSPRELGAGPPSCG